LNDTAENDVLTIQPRTWNSAQEELTPICVRTSIGHGKNTRAGVLQLEVLICEFVSLWMMKVEVKKSEIATPP
jgi:hypothetical protein